MSGYPHAARPTQQPSTRRRAVCGNAQISVAGAGGSRDWACSCSFGASFPWYGLAATDVNGYGFGSPAPVAIGLSLLASGVAAARVLDQKSASPLVPLAAAAVAALVSFGLIVDRGDNVSLNIGLILALVTTLLQAAAFALAWLHEIGRLGAAARSARWSGNTPYGYGTQEAGNGPGSSAYPAPTRLCRAVGIRPVGIQCHSRLRQTQVMPQGSANPYGYSPAGTPSTTSRLLPDIPSGMGSQDGLAISDQRLRAAPWCCPEPVAILPVDTPPRRRPRQRRRRRSASTASVSPTMLMARVGRPD